MPESTLTPAPVNTVAFPRAKKSATRFMATSKEIGGVFAAPTNEVGILGTETRIQASGGLGLGASDRKHFAGPTMTTRRSHVFLVMVNLALYVLHFTRLTTVLCTPLEELFQY